MKKIFISFVFCFLSLFLVEYALGNRLTFLFDDNFVFFLSGDGNVSFYHKNESNEIKDINLKFKVFSFVGIERFKSSDPCAVGVRLCVLSYDNVERVIKIEASRDESGGIHYWIFLNDISISV